MHKRGFAVKGIIKEYKRALKDLGINVEGVILYGSFAKGNQRQDSDIDLIIVSKDFQKMNLFQQGCLLIKRSLDLEKCFLRYHTTGRRYSLIFDS